MIFVLFKLFFVKQFMLCTTKSLYLLVGQNLTTGNNLNILFLKYEYKQTQYNDITHCEIIATIEKNYICYSLCIQ